MSSFLLNDLKNFNEIFKENVTYDNLNSLQRSGSHPLSIKYNCGKTLLPLQAFLGLMFEKVFPWSWNLSKLSDLRRNAISLFDFKKQIFGIS